MKKELNKTKGIFVKNSKMSLAKSTTALTCLVGALIVSSNLGSAATTTGSMIASGSVSSTCSVSGATLSFAAYQSSEITANSVITANCTNGTTYAISFNDTPDTGTVYYLVRSGGSSATASDRLEVSFKNGAGTTMTNGAATITGTGTGSAATAGTITGTMAASQTGKTAGSYSKTMTLNIVY
jgi:spore coat protein U-like protein